MDYYKWLTIGILVTLVAIPPSLTDQSPSPSRLSLSITTIKQWLWKAGELATFGLKDGSAVAQHTWTVKNIEDKISQAKHSSHNILSPPFYTDVPGYKFRLSLYLYSRNTSYIALYLDPVIGQFDDLLTWPFDNRYEFSSAGPDGTTFASDSTNPSTECTRGVFDRPPFNSAEGCGAPKYIDIETLLSNKTSYLIDGALTINVTIYLED